MDVNTLPIMTNHRWWPFLAGRLDELEWTPAELSRRAGVAESRITEWKTAGCKPSIESALRVANALDVSLLVVLEQAGYLTAGDAHRHATLYYECLNSHKS